MKIETIKDLEAVVRMCKRHGVTSIAVDGISMLINEPVEKPNSEQPGAAQQPTPDQYTDTDLMFWSAGQLPDNG